MTPPELLREQVEESRRRGYSFNAAWPGAVSRALRDEPWQSATFWRCTFREQRPLWHLLLVAALMLVGLSGAGCTDSTDNGDSNQRGANQQGGSGQGSGGSGSGGPELTSNQERAVRSAQNILDPNGVSRLALMNYLTEVKGFTKADAAYAADHVRATWKEEAVESAQRRVDGTGGYSPTNLIRHLTQLEGFTKADAVYAAFHVDVDWRHEAWEAAAGLRNRGGFTKAELLEQLKSDGFSAMDAQYGVDKAY